MSAPETVELPIVVGVLLSCPSCGRPQCEAGSDVHEVSCPEVMP